MNLEGYVAIYSAASAKSYGFTVYRIADGREIEATAIYNPDNTPNYLAAYTRKFPDAKEIGPVRMWVRRVGSLVDHGRRGPQGAVTHASTQSPGS